MSSNTEMETLGFSGIKGLGLCLQEIDSSICGRFYRVDSTHLLILMGFLSRTLPLNRNAFSTLILLVNS